MTPGIEAGLFNEHTVLWVLHLCVDVVGTHVHTRLESFTTRFLLILSMSHFGAEVLHGQQSYSCRPRRLCVPQKDPPPLNEMRRGDGGNNCTAIVPEENNLIW